MSSIGVDLGGTKIEAIVLGADGGTLWQQRVATPQADYRGTLAAIAGLVERADAAVGHGTMPVGVGTPGTLAPAGLIKNANSTCLNGQPLQRDLEALLHRPVRLANDANCLALSEAADGAAAGADVVFAAILGTGVGGGIVVHGRLLTGANGLAGEWGHTPLRTDDADGPPPACYCGQRGCIETWLSGPAMAGDHRRRTGHALDAAQIAADAEAGDADCRETLRRYEERLARALAQVINLLDPDVIVLGGGLSQIESLYRTVPKRWARHVFSAGSSKPPRTQLLRSRYGDASGVRGAARLWASDAGWR